MVYENIIRTKKFCRIAGCEIYIQKSVLSLDICKEQPETEVQETMLFLILKS